MLQMFAELFKPLGATAEDIAAATIASIEPGGHFFAAPHTMERFREAFYVPLVSDWQNFGRWQEAGSRTATDRAATIWKSILLDYSPPARDAAVLEALSSYVEVRSREGGAFPVTG